MVDQSRPTSIPGVKTFHRREVWQDPKMPVVGPSPTLEQWDTFPLHYTAADDLIDGDPGEHADDLPGYLRAIQRDYTVNRGYSIGYGFAVDWLGGVWELRGYDIRNAANRGWNLRTGPVLCLVDGADPLTDEALWSVRALYREANRRTGRSLTLAGHRDIGATACPGDGIYRQITSGLVTPLTDAELNPTTPTPPPTPEPPALEEDIMEVIQVDGDATQYIRSGFTARWAESGPEKQRDALTLGFDPKPRRVDRSFLRSLTLVGPQPQGEGVTTSYKDFGGHVA